MFSILQLTGSLPAANVYVSVANFAIVPPSPPSSSKPVASFTKVATAVNGLLIKRRRLIISRPLCFLQIALNIGSICVLCICALMYPWNIFEGFWSCETNSKIGARKILVEDCLSSLERLKFALLSSNRGI